MHLFDLSAFFLLHFLADSRQEDREFIFAIQMQQLVDQVLVVDAQCTSAGIDRFARQIQVFHDRTDVDQDFFVRGDVVFPLGAVRDAAP